MTQNDSDVSSQDSSAEAQRPHKPADDTEEIYFQGSPRLRGELGRFSAFALFGLLLILGPILLDALTSAHVSFDLSAKAPILYPKGRSKGSKEFELLAKSATLPEPVRETANISEAVLPQIQLAANENLSESFEICAG